MVRLLPEVHRLLILLPALEQEHIDDALVRDVAVLLELAPDGVPELLCGDGDGVQGDNLGCLWAVREGGAKALAVKVQWVEEREETDPTVPVAIELDGPLASLLWAGGGCGGARQTRRDRASHAEVRTRRRTVTSVGLRTVSTGYGLTARPTSGSE